MEHTENDNKDAGAPSALNVGLERRFWVWWKESGWKGNADADAAFEAWMEAAKIEREECANTVAECEDDLTSRWILGRAADRIRARSN